MMEYLILNLKAFKVFPRKQDFPRVIRDFDGIGSYFPNVIGAMDGCHLEIELHGSLCILQLFTFPLNAPPGCVTGRPEILLCKCWISRKVSISIHS